jgi:hypothetical protein
VLESFVCCLLSLVFGGVFGLLSFVLRVFCLICLLSFDVFCLLQRVQVVCILCCALLLSNVSFDSHSCSSSGGGGGGGVAERRLALQKVATHSPYLKDFTLF